MARGLLLAGLGRGQILTAVARRRADGLLVLGRGDRGGTAPMPRPACQDFPAPLAAARVDAVLGGLAARPLSLVRRRDRGEDIRVFPVGAVMGQRYAPGAQAWRAAVELPDGGGRLMLERTHDAGAPGALDALAATFAGEAGPLRQVAGVVRAEGGVLVCEPWSLGCDRFVVPDLEAAGPEAVGPPAVGGPRDATVPGQALDRLAAAVHAGRRGRDPAAEAAVVAALERDGFTASARRLAAWAAEPGVDAFGRAAVWLSAMRES